MRLAYQSDYYQVELADGVVTVHRTARTYPDLATLDAEHRALDQAMAPLRGLPLLVDLRDAPGRNDPEFEARMRTNRLAIFRGAPRACVLVRTAAGVLQVRRHVQEDGLDGRVTVTNDPEEAARVLRARL